MAAIIHGMLLLVCVLLIPGILNLIPLSALAAILILTGYKLAKFGLFQDMYKQGFTQFLPFVITIVAILFTDLLIGIGIGLVVGIFFILRENYRSSHGGYQRESVGGGEHIRINLSEHVSFLNKAGIAEMLDNLPENTTVEIDGTQSSYIDHDILETIENFRDTAKRRNIRLYFLRKGEEPAQPAQQPEPEPKQDHQRSFAEYNRLFDNNRKWVQEKLQVDPEYFNNLAWARVPSSVHRLLRQPRARERNHRHGPRRGIRAPQRGQPRGKHRPQPAVGVAVRGGSAQGGTRDRVRPLRLRRREGVHA
jgi:carbonic anhydrase